MISVRPLLIRPSVRHSSVRPPLIRPSVRPPLIRPPLIRPCVSAFYPNPVEDAEVVLLNDFRWHPSIIAWGDFLQLLEGDTVHIPAPKNVYSQDIEFSKDTPFFATADSPMVLVKGGSLDVCNTQMMEVR